VAAIRTHLNWAVETRRSFWRSFWSSGVLPLLPSAIHRNTRAARAQLPRWLRRPFVDECDVRGRTREVRRNSAPWGEKATVAAAVSFADLVNQLCEAGLRDVALTTNGVLLSKFAKPLYEAGLRRLNVHVDSLDRDRFQKITRRDDLERVLAGIDAAIETGYTSIKLNAVAIRGLTEPDVIPLARFARERHLEIRYIEFMPLDSQHL